MNYTENFNLNKPSVTDYVNITDFNNNADTIDAVMKAIQNMIAPAFDTMEQYVRNALVVYENKLYKCIVETSTVGDFVNTDWQEITIAELLEGVIQ